MHYMYKESQGLARRQAQGRACAFVRGYVRELPRLGKARKLKGVHAHLFKSVRELRRLGKARELKGVHAHLFGYVYVRT